MASLIALATLAACTVKETGATEIPDCPVPEGGTTPPTGDAGPSGDLGECVTYQPAAIDGTKSGTFTSGTDVVSIPLAATDVGGGLLKVTAAAQTQALEVSLWLGEGEKKDEARWEGGALDGETQTFYFRLHGGKSYELRAQATNYRDDKTNGYTVTWAYEPLVDCYEGNDTREAAKRIPVNTPIKAFLHAGIGPNDGRLVGPTADDWYWFELAEQRSVTMRVNVPGDNTAFFSVRDGEDVEVSCDDPNFGVHTSATDTAEDMASCSATLAPGKYWVRGGLGNSEEPGTGPGDAVPRTWNTPYTLTIDAK
ncbi:MAG: hypothetical protein KIT84_44665 [Labilithrix sp.]|nr:hypothetical protein [Labilithrix sp.]MCW5818174.1 hypothetical protein [Labilithrix sp.]